MRIEPEEEMNPPQEQPPMLEATDILNERIAALEAENRALAEARDADLRTITDLMMQVDIAKAKAERWEERATKMLPTLAAAEQRALAAEAERDAAKVMLATARANAKLWHEEHDRINGMYFDRWQELKTERAANERLRAAARKIRRGKCSTCAGTGISLGYKPTFYETDTAAEQEDARLMASRPCKDCAELAAALADLPAPSPTGAPSYWLIHFEDAAMRPEVFTDESAARARLAQLRLNWDCRLFADQPAPEDTRGHGSGPLPGRGPVTVVQTGEKTLFITEPAPSRFPRDKTDEWDERQDRTRQVEPAPEEKP